MRRWSRVFSRFSGGIHKRTPTPTEGRTVLSRRDDLDCIRGYAHRSNQDRIVCDTGRLGQIIKKRPAGIGRAPYKWGPKPHTFAADVAAFAALLATHVVGIEGDEAMSVIQSVGGSPARLIRADGRTSCGIRL